mgnify:CR=1 FL=1
MSRSKTTNNMMKNPLRSSYSTEGRRMAGARALWRANGLKEEQFGKPIIAIVNSFTSLYPAMSICMRSGSR